MNRLITRLKLLLFPPKAGDIFWTDSFDFVAGRPLEHILHGLKNVNGDSVWEPVYGKDTCRMKILSDSMPYFIVQCEILAVHWCGGEKAWAPRQRPRRMWKTVFKQMLIEGSIKRV